MSESFLGSRSRLLAGLAGSFKASFKLNFKASFEPNAELYASLVRAVSLDNRQLHDRICSADLGLAAD